MRCQGIATRWAAAILLAAFAQAGLAQEPLPAPVPAVKEEPKTSFSVTGRYTAQRKPRVAVLEFEDTNEDAKNQRYGPSVQAMLVTYLKRKSQLVVVERQKLGDVIAEWRRNQNGLTNLQPTDPEARELLEKLDAIIIGSVTLLDQMAVTEAQAGEESEGGARQGQRIEIDAKLLSRSDGRIIAAAQRDGPVSCLRAIVERLGVALEQDYLRPYFGKLKVTLSEPEQVTVFLTPILLDTALDEEKPPVERGATIRSKPKKDTVEPWTTDPTTYTIENLLSGWYSMRLERPGYEGQSLESSQWEARDDGIVHVYDRASARPLERVSRELRRFVVHVDPQSVETLAIDALDFTFRKLGGSLDPRVKRQYLDTDYTHKPARVVLLSREPVEEDDDKAGKPHGDPRPAALGKAEDRNGDKGKKKGERERPERLDINDLRPPGEYGDDEDCDLFEERTPNRSDYGRTVVTAGQTFDLESFKGGSLFIEDYQGEVLPVGDYQMTVWEPGYQPYTSMITVRDQDDRKPVRSSLIRETGSLSLTTTGTRPSNKVILEGKATHYRTALALDFSGWKVQESLPLDVYRATTDIEGLAGWSREVELTGRSSQAPFLDIRDEVKGPILRLPGVEEPEEAKATLEIPRQRIKTRMAIGGRLDALSAPPDPTLADLHIDREATLILDLLLYGQPKQQEEAGGGLLLDMLAALGKGAVQVLASVVQVDVSLGPTGPSAGSSISPVPGGSVPQPANQPVSQPAKVEPPAAPPAPALEPVATYRVNPEELRRLLVDHLQSLDLLILDDEDLARVREMPEITAILARYVETGGALFAFAAGDGDYTRLFGSPLVLRADGKPTETFELAPGEVSGLSLRAGAKKLKVKGKRVLPEIQRLDARSDWRVLAYGKSHREARILERGYRDQGGYVAVWLDSPASFRGHWGGTVPEVEEARNRVERYVFDWARTVMQRRYGKPVAQPVKVTSN